MKPCYLLAGYAGGFCPRIKTAVPWKSGDLVTRCPPRLLSSQVGHEDQAENTESLSPENCEEGLMGSSSHTVLRK